MYTRTALIVSVIVVGLISPLVHADDQTSSALSDGQIATIRTTCVSVQSALTRISASDALSRVSLAREYETISGKLMAPMNSRVALNKLNGVALAKTTAEFNSKTDEFRSLYKEYEDTIANALSMKCSDQPVAFYDTISLARTRRETLHNCAVTLDNLAKQYLAQVSELQKNSSTTNGGNAS